ncbi:MAG TPA: efflux RND transporter permease subunit [Candidatus Saccharimonadales bacterium]|jgi:CzcA family heavy metal efflux pump|nr:efflux RND transporter permease subunit [Candidatus Saccharimonadales bacterium]
MWIVALALRRPYTFVVMALLILILSPIVIFRTSVDILPDIDIPVISVIWQFQGFSAQEMNDRIINNTERGLTTIVNDIEHTETQSMDGRAITKVFLQPGANLQLAMSQVTAISQSGLRQLPAGTQPPLIIVYSASSVPIMQVGISSHSLPEQALNDLSVNFIRPQMVTVQGAAVPFPYGGKQRVVAVDIDSALLQGRGLTAVDVVNALSVQNLILPSGSLKMGSLQYQVDMNGSADSIAELSNLPIKTQNGATTYLKDVAHVRDGFSPQTNMVRADGVRGTLITVQKNGGASTLEIIARMKQTLARVATTLPEDLAMKPLFDQSLFVRASIQGVVHEAITAACLTAAMILLFLGNWRTTLVIAISIPLSILCSIITLSALGQTFNLMTLGGMALAVGILVDDATVEIENIERNLAMGKELKTAILDGAAQIAVPAFVSTLSICIVFVPMFFLTGVARFLFVPLAEAVVFAMLASYLLSRTLVPTLVMYLLRGYRHETGGEPVQPERAGMFAFLNRLQRGFEAGFERLRGAYHQALAACLEHHRSFITCFLAFCVLSLGLVFFLGQDFFPDVDAGIFRMHVRGRAGLRIEETARLCDQIENTMRQEIPREELATILDNIGLAYSSINNSYSTSGTVGASDAEILVSLNQQKHGPTAEYVKHLREELPRLYPGVEFFFQPADIVSQILNFGLPSPIDIQVIGKGQAQNYQIAQQIANRLRHVPGAADVHVQQLMSSPALTLNVDRTRAQQVGLEQRDVAQNLLVSLSGSFQTTPTFFLNRENGVSYNIAVQTPEYRMDSLQALMNTPVASPRAPGEQVLANLATIKPGVTPTVVSHYNIQPVMDVYASVQGRDLGGVARDTRRIVDEFRRKLPRGVQIVVRGQVETMASSFLGLGIGLVLSIVLVYLLIVINFQSWLDPFIIISALPGALAGIVWMLLLTRTTLNVPSLTGAVMCMGVATANSILVISFARERMAEGLSAWDAVLEAGYTRMRPVIMTALAMIIGMTPMALGLGEGGEQNAPLGRAVIGGLMFATVATLFLVPVVFSVLHGGKRNVVKQIAS